MKHIPNAACRMLLLWVLCLPATPGYSFSKVTEIKPIDGDSFTFAGMEARMQGIDAPEWKQRCRNAQGQHYACGEMAAAHLRDLVRGKQVQCRWEGADSYGRKLATCQIDGMNVNEQMVRDGWALAYRRYSTAYIQAEERAKKEKRGMWAGSFQKPWDWRFTQR